MGLDQGLVELNAHPNATFYLVYADRWQGLKSSSVEGCGIPPIPQNTRNGWGTRQWTVRSGRAYGEFGGSPGLFLSEDNCKVRAGFTVFNHRDGSEFQHIRSEEHTSELKSLRHLV